MNKCCNRCKFRNISSEIYPCIVCVDCRTHFEQVEPQAPIPQPPLAELRTEIQNLKNNFYKAVETLETKHQVKLHFDFENNKLLIHLEIPHKK